MAKKVNKVEKKLSFIESLERIHGRYQLVYDTCVILGVVAIALIWFFTNNFWGSTALVFGFWSWSWYEEGEYRNCAKKSEYTHKDALRLMFKSWPWFAVLAVIAYFLCKAYIPQLFN